MTQDLMERAMNHHWFRKFPIEAPSVQARWATARACGEGGAPAARGGAPRAVQFFHL